ncbi:putative Histone-lysine N-methyltransferase SUV420H14-20 [Heracleum sosnowskyi]|uniref:Histone-lysine N-methyltransferase SUV420H14-20 n=1 Tax=Heracleum sosnowskyi TaxID=360622 RepID=A0AAD8H977_9APIA|nr:putative Histone-lysine N-methyltransferase SUV420H14-20 [Heracleum sosnowskyi]
MTRGIGGPLLCIGDLLSDVGEESTDVDDGVGSSSFSRSSSLSSTTFTPNSTLDLQSSHLPQLFQETYDQLKEALGGSDHSWTALTLKLCTALETANQLVQATSSNAGSLSKKIQELEKIIKRGDEAVAAARAIHSDLKRKDDVSDLKNP